MKVIRFSAQWCQPCKQLAKILEAEGLDVPYLDIDEETTKPLIAKYGVRSVPTIVIDSGDQFELITGALLNQEKKDKIRQALVA